MIQMSTGVEKDEEVEEHLQAVIREQEASKTFTSRSSIPIPSVDTMPRREYEVRREERGGGGRQQEH